MDIIIMANGHDVDNILSLYTKLLNLKRGCLFHFLDTPDVVIISRKFAGSVVLNLRATGMWEPGS